MTNSHSPKRATISDVSRLAQVSTATVSRVLNRPDVVSKETISRVQAAIKEVDYIPNPSARVLAGGKTSTIGLIVPEIGDRTLLPMLSGIETGTRENSYHLLIYSTGQRTISSEELLKAMGPHNTDGLLVYVNSLDEIALRHLNKIGTPIVLLHQIPPPNLKLPYVTFQNTSAVKELVDHLIEVHGYRRIAFLRGPKGHDDSRLREMGYLESLKSHGIAYRPELVGFGGFNPRDSAETVTAWIAAGLGFDAIFCGDDMAAFGTIQALEKAGLRVPEDVAIAGFDDIDIGYNISPPLTTVHADFQRAGFQATLMLAKLINKVRPKSVVLPTHLVIRRSCGCWWS